MLGAKPAMEASGIKTLAEVSKGASWEIEQLRLARAMYDIKNGVVIQLGTNAWSLATSTRRCSTSFQPPSFR